MLRLASPTTSTFRFQAPASHLHPCPSAFIKPLPVPATGQVSERGVPSRGGAEDVGQHRWPSLGKPTAPLTNSVQTRRRFDFSKKNRWAKHPAGCLRGQVWATSVIYRSGRCLCAFTRLERRKI